MDEWRHPNGRASPVRSPTKLLADWSGLGSSGVVGKKIIGSQTSKRKIENKKMKN